MEKFIIQNDDCTNDIESIILKNKIDRNCMLSYETMKLQDIQKIGKEKIEYPIGTIEFVTKYLSLYDNKLNGHTIQNPIEIPKYLRTDEMLKRDYSIIRGSDISLKGYKFIKNASRLKQGTYLGELAYYKIKDNEIIPDDLYIISSDFKPLSEYRVYVFNNDIETITLYDGDYSLYPDIKLINKAINIIMLHEKYLKSYTLDVMVNKTGTALIEIHDFTSVGLYTTLFGNYLPYAYIDGIEYLLNDNHAIEI